MNKALKTKKFIGKLITISFTDREPISGIVLDCNDDWILMKYNVVDYVIDGYILLRHKNIISCCRESEEKFKEKILHRKGKILDITKKDLVPIQHIETTLRFLSNKYSYFLLETKSEKACYLGCVKSIDTKQLVIRYLNPKGKWAGNMKFRLNDIRVIMFETDYIKSLALITKKTKKVSWY